MVNTMYFITIMILLRLLVNKSTNHWMRIQYTRKYENPITYIKVIECDYESPEYLVTIKYKLN